MRNIIRRLCGTDRIAGAFNISAAVLDNLPKIIVQRVWKMLGFL